MTKIFNDEMEMYRVSGRCKLSKKSVESLEESGNKSAFLAEAINFYVSFGQIINERLQNIDEKLDSVQLVKGVMHSSVETPIQNQSVDSIIKDEIETEEERKQREMTESMLIAFMDYSAESGD